MPSPGGTTRDPVGEEQGPEQIVVPGMIPGKPHLSGKHTATQLPTPTPEQEAELKKGMEAMAAFRAADPSVIQEEEPKAPSAFTPQQPVEPQKPDAPQEHKQDAPQEHKKKW